MYAHIQHIYTHMYKSMTLAVYGTDASPIMYGNTFIEGCLKVTFHVLLHIEFHPYSQKKLWLQMHVFGVKL